MEQQWKLHLLIVTLILVQFGCSEGFDPYQLVDQQSQVNPIAPDAPVDPPRSPPPTPTPPPVDPPPPAKDYGPLVFNIVLRQSHQPCGGCGIFFHPQGVQSQNPRVEVMYEIEGQTIIRNYQDGLGPENQAHALTITPSGNEAPNVVLIKARPDRRALVMANMSDIPGEAKILRTRLYLHFHTHEGMSYDDTSSELTVYHNPRIWKLGQANWTHFDQGQRWSSPGGDIDGEIRKILAKRDIIDQGFHKHRPHAHFDLTKYVQDLQSERSLPR
ncbi:MAG: hypothetical protein H6624_02605 [Bdellovibrionaceae bacterium]|nr:hypothetical protein [Bdellovibrionales bacterium]MCB9083202.1 hypothetical protein [Pseudobdellovibrionaceae bacterium]